MSSTTPTPPRASLTERRKAETRMEIALAAAGLFVRQGLRATRAEDIAQAAGIAPRTFYRYFATKEEAVAPLYAVGAQRWVEAVRAAPAGVGAFEALTRGIRHALTPDTGVPASSWDWVRALLRLAEANPSLRRVWADVCQASERMLGEALAERVTRAGTAEGRAAPDGADSAATAPGLRPAASEPRLSASEPRLAASEPRLPAPEPRLAAFEPRLPASEPRLPASEPRLLASEPRLAASEPRLPAPEPRLAAFEPRPPAPEPPLPVSEPPLPAPAPRLAAAVASAAVRVALEGWAEGDGPVEGPGSPVELALRNLEELRDFPWGP